jgi:hypothetical protein
MTLRRWSSAVVLGLVAGCASRGSETAEPTAAPARSLEATNRERSSAPNPGANPTTQLETANAGESHSVDAASHGESSPAAAPNGSASFPPPDFAPPSKKSAALGDGDWTPFVASAGAASSPLVARAVVHPHPDSKWVTVTVAAVDLERLRIRFVPGTDDLLWAKRTPSADAGLVAHADLDGLVAMMNGGFQPKHGHFGMIANHDVIVPPRPDACTLVVGDDGSVRLGPWAALAPLDEHTESLRQTPACLLLGGTLHADLLRGNDKRWAGHASDLHTRRRSAVGIDASGKVLFYGIGEEADPRWLAEGMRAAGAVAAAEFDINWYWTRFLAFERDAAGTTRISSSLIPKMEHQSDSYVARPSTRDFFYFVQRR